MTRIKAGMKRIGNQESGGKRQESEGRGNHGPADFCSLIPDSW